MALLRLQVLVEQIQVQRVRSIVLVDQTLQVVGVAGQLANGVHLVLEEVLLQIVGHLGIALLLDGVRVMQVQLVRLRRQHLFGVEGERQSGQLVQLVDHLLVGLVVLGEVVAAAAFRHLLDQVDGVVPRLVGQREELLLEAGPVLQVAAKVGGEQQVLVGLGQLMVGVALESLGMVGVAGEEGVTFGGFVCGGFKKHNY